MKRRRQAACRRAPARVGRRDRNGRSPGGGGRWMPTAASPDRAGAVRPQQSVHARATLESIGDAVITTDTTCRVTYLNPVAERLTGWAAAEAAGQPVDIVLPLINESSREPVANTAARSLAEGRPIDLEDGVLLRRRDGTEVPIGDSTAPIRDRHGRTIGTVLVIQDESEKRRVGRRLSHEATHDALTGLVNRREFERRLARVVLDPTERASEHVLFYLDLDGFKRVNDVGGHDAGDALLRTLSAQFNRHMRKRDTLARLGGDEFGILLENCPLSEAERIAGTLQAEVALQRFGWEGQVFSIGASIGVIPVTPDLGGVAGALAAADAACYAAKRGGGSRVHIARDRPRMLDPTV